MIGRIRGTLAEKNPPAILVDVHGIGYEVDVPMSTFYGLPECGQAVTLFTHFAVREDGQYLYGFASREEQATFRQLLKVSGIGARTALAVLSGLSVGELRSAVALQEAGRLVKIPGIGKKTAERIVVELRDRASDFAQAGAALRAGGVPQDPVTEASVALQQLGYKPAEISRLLRDAPSGADSEGLIRHALKSALKT